MLAAESNDYRGERSQAYECRIGGRSLPERLENEYWFEYGKKGSFESKTTVTEAGSNDAWHAEHSTVSALEPCHEYQFRVVAENEDSHNGPPKGDVYGETKILKRSASR